MAFRISGDRVAYRGRIAPSPTGLLHLGHARTFWIAQQRALAAGGALVLRNEDLDPERSRPEFAAAMLEDLRWLGLRWQEGPDVGGPFGPYAQSVRRPVYLQAWRHLLAGGWLYPCRCSRKDLAQMAGAPHGDEAMYPGICRPAQRFSTRPPPSPPPLASTGASGWPLARQLPLKTAGWDRSVLSAASTLEISWFGAGMMCQRINLPSSSTTRQCI